MVLFHRGPKWRVHKAWSVWHHFHNTAVDILVVRNNWLPCSHNRDSMSKTYILGLIDWQYSCKKAHHSHRNLLIKRRRSDIKTNDFWWRCGRYSALSFITYSPHDRQSTRHYPKILKNLDAEPFVVVCLFLNINNMFSDGARSSCGQRVWGLLQQFIFHGQHRK
jgi:hypothetical protein